jgi:argininosuccinate synthase
VNGEALSPVALVELLNEIGGLHGVGRADIVEDRMVGMKSRGVYETPGGTLLYTAHRELEQLVLDRRTLALKDQLAARYADLVYDGRWWGTEREALDALVDRTQQCVTGTVRMKLYRGSAIIAGRSTPYPLYDAGLASFGDDGTYDHADAAGFIRLLSLPTRAEARQQAQYAAAVAAANGQHETLNRHGTPPRLVIEPASVAAVPGASAQAGGSVAAVPGAAVTAPPEAPARQAAAV